MEIRERPVSTRPRWAMTMPGERRLWSALSRLCCREAAEVWTTSHQLLIMSGDRLASRKRNCNRESSRRRLHSSSSDCDVLRRTYPTHQAWKDQDGIALRTSF